MSDTQTSLATPPVEYGDWLADLKGRIHNTQATAPSSRKNHSD